MATGVYAADGSYRVTLATSESGATSPSAAEDSASADGDTGIKNLAVRKATPANTSGTDGDYEFLQMSAGRLWVSATVTDLIPGVAATNIGKAEDAAHTSGDTGVMALGVRNDTPTVLSGTTLDYTPLTFNAYGGLWSSLVDNSGNPVSFNGATSVNRMLSAAASTNGTNVKASSGKIYTISGKNAAAAIRYLKLYNTAGVPTVGTDTPVATLEIAASAAFIFDFPAGWYFATGIGFGWTTAQADNSTAALTAADVTSQNIWFA